MKNLFIIILIGIFTTSCSWLQDDPFEQGISQEEPKEVAEAESKESPKEEPKEELKVPPKASKKEPKNKIEESIKSAPSIDSHYGILIEDLGLQIKKLQSELDFFNEELYSLKAQSQVWENPFSIYNKEIVLDNGTTIYGKIIYQDQDIIKVETLIGGLTIDRATIVKVTENIVEMLPKDSLSAQPLKNFIRDGAIIETQQISSATDIERKKSKPSANLIILGSIYEKTDENGNVVLTGDIKNIGKERADFAKINFLFRMNWKGDTKPLTCFVKGSIQDLGNGVISDASIEPESIGKFELFIPKSFGEFISYSYALDWEQYE